MYCTLADLLEQVPERTLVQLTNEELDFDSPATVKTGVVDSCIRYADELIDAHLRGRYTLPLAEVAHRSAGHRHYDGALPALHPPPRRCRPGHREG